MFAVTVAPLLESVVASSSVLQPMIQHRVAGLNFSLAEPAVAAERIARLAQDSGNGDGVSVHLANAYCASLASSDRLYRQVLLSADYVFPDGKPISWVSKLLGQSPALRQVRGPQFFLDVIDKGRSIGLRHFFLGGSEALLLDLRRELSAKYPGVVIAGSYSPPFRVLTSEEVSVQDDMICRAKPHIVWVGLGTPKQDFEVARLSNDLGMVAIAVGAAFNFAAGHALEAPRWMRRMGLEWLFRLATEPRRLWRRYVFGNANFIRMCLTEALLNRRTGQD